ncbi:MULTISPECIES: hypothetical protein [unclassified Streptomyces]|uniref:hypothetical protein n=1 Tax=unclassified Streptomyces TaxID=2593676 RepID=UPI000804C7F5|nr:MULTISPECIES: hypothetical protein [unclassified Streptomyces]NUW02523.1 hypothetical protein [Streptomyces sp. CAI 127]SBU91796.1 hypothetical protein YW5DRAFT_03751 [Streptomyces sp. Ncost-T6T-1]
MATRRGFITGASGIGTAALLGYAAAPQAAAATADGAAGAAKVSPQQAKDSLLAVNAGMRTNYAVLKAELIKHLSPVIVVQNDAKGGRFTLVTENGQESANPVSETFELAKSIAHVPLGIFSVIASYLADHIPNLPNADRIDPHDLLMVAFDDHTSTAWIPPLQAYAATLTTARRNLPDAGLPAALTTSCGNILDAALRFIDTSVTTQSFDMKSFEDFSGSVYPDIRTNMEHAAQAQIKGVQDQMTAWRAKVGEAGWADLYCVVISQWTTSVLNQNTIIIKDCMNPAKVATHLIDLPGLENPVDPVFTALDNLARIVQDNVAAEMVFPKDTKVADALKGKEDLLSDEILIQLGTARGVTKSAPTYNMAAGAVCPIKK